MADVILDAMRDVVAWLVTAATVAATWWISWVTRRVMTNTTNLAVLEDAIGRLPKEFDDLQGTLREMRTEAGAGRERIYKHVESVRKELKADIKDVRRD